MAIPFPSLSIDIGLDAAVQAILDARNRRNDELAKLKDQSLITLKEELEVAFIAISALEEIFIDLVSGFSNDEIINDPEALKMQVEQTKKFLRSRKILPHLERSMGVIYNAGMPSHPRFGSRIYMEMVSSAGQLSIKLSDFRKGLGDEDLTGPGIISLKELCYMAEQQLANAGLTNFDIKQTAELAFNSYNWGLTSDIRRLIGYVKMSA